MIELDISESEAFINNNFAPLNLRRDIGMLGFLHKRVLGQVHPCFFDILPFRQHMHPGNHTKQLDAQPSPIHFQQMLWRRSIFGLVSVYNQFPQHVIDLPAVKEFQSCLTSFAKQRCSSRVDNWQFFFDADVFYGTF